MLIATTIISCKKETTSPNNPTDSNNLDGNLISKIIIKRPKFYLNDSLNYIDAKETQINFIYDNNSRLIKLISTSNEGVKELNFILMNGVIVYDTTELKVQLNNDNLCVKLDNFNFEYKDGFLSKIGLKKGADLAGKTIEKDTFIDCLWSNNNLISDGFYEYEYYENLLNNNFFYLYPDISEIVTLDAQNSFSVFLQNFELGGNFYSKMFGKASKNLLKKITHNYVFGGYNWNEVFELFYTMDSKNRINEIKIKMTGKDDHKDDITTITYIWK